MLETNTINGKCLVISYNESPLIVSIRSENEINLLKELKKNNINININKKSYFNQSTPLYVTCEYGNIKFLEY